MSSINDVPFFLEFLTREDIYPYFFYTRVKEIGRKNNCTFCGVFRRQALDRGAQQLKVDCIATGHNADDIAETVIMNILRGDTARLRRCTNIRTEGDDSIPRVKPLKYTYEKEIVMYAHFKKLIYFSTECTFAPNAYRGHARKYLKDLEKIRPAVIMDIIHSGMGGHLFAHLLFSVEQKYRTIFNLSGEQLRFKDSVKKPIRGTCDRCGFVSSQQPCKACVLLEGLNRGLPKLGIGKKSKGNRMIAEQERELAIRERAQLVKNDF